MVSWGFLKLCTEASPVRTGGAYGISQGSHWGPPDEFDLKRWIIDVDGEATAGTVSKC